MACLQTAVRAGFVCSCSDQGLFFFSKARRTRRSLCSLCPLVEVPKPSSSVSSVSSAVQTTTTACLPCWVSAEGNHHPALGTVPRGQTRCWGIEKWCGFTFPSVLVKRRTLSAYTSKVASVQPLGRRNYPLWIDRTFLGISGTERRSSSERKVSLAALGHLFICPYLGHLTARELGSDFFFFSFTK